jgi:outer membrane protein OmpA-like peptidoglycan-associated protein
VELSGFRARIAALLAVALGACAPMSGLETRARILAQPSCSDFFFPIYFAPGSVEVNGAARRVMQAAGRRSEGCRIEEVKAVGLPDPDSHDPQMALPRERARRVASALQAAGFPAPTFQLSPLGEAGEALPGAKTPRRRADVFVRFAR